MTSRRSLPPVSFRIRRIVLLIGIGLAITALAFWIRSSLIPIQTVHWDRAPAGNSFKIIDTPVPANSTSRPIRRADTFAHWVLDIESKADPVPPARYELLDSIIADATARLAFAPADIWRRSEHERILNVFKTIDQVLTDHGVLYPPGDFDVPSLRLGLCDQSLDGDVLRRILRVSYNARRRDWAANHMGQPFHIMDCDIASLVYLGVGDALGIELHLVDLPDHMFVRFILGDGSHINWDTNDASSPTDDDFARDFDISKSQVESRAYLATLTREQARGYIYSMRAANWEQKRELGKAIADLQQSLALYPQSPQTRAALARLTAMRDRP